jgi:hypothetical protein
VPGTALDTERIVVGDSERYKEKKINEMCKICDNCYEKNETRCCIEKKE